MGGLLPRRQGARRLRPRSAHAVHAEYPAADRAPDHPALRGVSLQSRGVLRLPAGVHRAEVGDRGAHPVPRRGVQDDPPAGQRRLLHPGGRPQAAGDEAGGYPGHLHDRAGGGLPAGHHRGPPGRPAGRSPGLGAGPAPLLRRVGRRPQGAGQGRSLPVRSGPGRFHRQRHHPARGGAAPHRRALGHGGGRRDGPLLPVQGGAGTRGPGQGRRSRRGSRRDGGGRCRSGRRRGPGLHDPGHDPAGHGRRGAAEGPLPQLREGHPLRQQVLSGVRHEPLRDDHLSAVRRQPARRLQVLPQLRAAAGRYASARCRRCRHRGGPGALRHGDRPGRRRSPRGDRLHAGTGRRGDASRRRRSVLPFGASCALP